MKRVLSGWLADSKKATTKSTKSKRTYPRVAEEYDLLEECGKGASGSVWRARCKQVKGEVAVKQINLETVGADVDTFVGETQTMSSLAHPNLLPLHCSFLHKESLWMVMPFVSGGSLQQVMSFRYPKGLEEAAICTIIRETLLGLSYLHKEGIIHRDIKAGNVLLGQDGTIWLADFGIAAKTNRTGSWGKGGGQRHTFAGTLCWMAPEIMHGENYDAKADIWSLGMLMLELAYGLPPFASMSAMKILATVLDEDPPRLEDQTGDRVWSRQFKDIVARCLVKQPEDRPGVDQLLKDKWFKNARPKEFIHEQLVAGVPDAMSLKASKVEAVQRQLASMSTDDEYQRTAWNFDITCLRDKRAASAPSAGTTPGLTPAPSNMSEADAAAAVAAVSPACRPQQDALKSPKYRVSSSSIETARTASTTRSLSHSSSLSRHSPDEPGTGPFGVAASTSAGKTPDWDWGDLAPAAPAPAAAGAGPFAGSTSRLVPHAHPGEGKAAGPLRNVRSAPVQPTAAASTPPAYHPRSATGGVMVGGKVIAPGPVGQGPGSHSHSRPHQPQQQQQVTDGNGNKLLSKMRSFNVQRKGRFTVVEGPGHSNTNSPRSAAFSPPLAGAGGSAGNGMHSNAAAHASNPSPSLRRMHTFSGGAPGVVMGSDRGSLGGEDYREKLVRESQRLQQQQQAMRARGTIVVGAAQPAQGRPGHAHGQAPVRIVLPQAEGGSA